jgi:hypothetical protein
MIISKNSLLRHPPVKLLPEQVIVFNVMTYSVDICETSYISLKEELKKFNENHNPKNEEQIFSKIFSQVWNIINNVTIFRNTIIKHFDITDDDPLITEFNIAKEMRNSHQHIDQRVSEVLSLNDLPVYGSLTWSRNFVNENIYRKYLIYSGTITNQKNIKEKISPSISNKEISDIHLTSVIREGKKPNYQFIQKTISIDLLIDELNKNIEHFEKQINGQVADKDISETHKSNLYMSIDLHKI